MLISAARLAALEILLRVQEQGAYASELLHSDRLASLSPSDRALCTELVMGVLRWQPTLDARLQVVSSQKLNRLDPEVLIALRLGTYQLHFLDRIPAHAAINESVELVKHARKKSAVPFANAVLRKLSSKARENPRDAGGSFAADSEVAGDKPDAVAAAWAHPPWLVARWAAEFGIETARRICEFDQQTPPTALRIPASENVTDELRAEGVLLAPGRLLPSAQVVLSGDLVHSRAYMEHRVAIQDEGSQLIAALVGHGSRILDCCAAPGGKTMALAAANPQATIVAAELHPHRAELLRRRIAESASRVEVITADATALPYGPEFDRILADVPCSGTGTLARNPEIKWKLRLDDLANLHARQKAILTAMLRHLAPGGVLVYSTCSLEPEENAIVVEEVLSENASAKLLDCRERLRAMRAAGELAWTDEQSLTSGPYLRTLPGVHPCDGFFAAMITL